MNNKKVGVVCVTYRNPEKPSVVREFGVVSLVEEMFQQKYDGEIALSIVDSSPEPHPYLQRVAERFPEKLVYTHIPDRNKAPEQNTDSTFIPNNNVIKGALALHMQKLEDIGQPVPQALINIIKADDFNDVDPINYDVLIGRKPSEKAADAVDIAAIKSKYPREATEANADVVAWEKRIAETKDIAGFVPFEDDYPIQANIFAQMFTDRPTIGMKKNFGVQALIDKGFDPEAIVFSDDDDHHSPDYVAKSVAALGDNDFTRMTRYMTHIFNADASIKEHAWSTFDLRVGKDANAYWRLDPQQGAETMFNLHPDGQVHESTVGKKFSRLVTMAWPILSHEGALHTYSRKAWERSVEKFGGCTPVSFCEDIIFYRRNKDAFGAEFKDVHTPIKPGEESFLRIADGGNNASVIEWMSKNEESNRPAWAEAAMKPVYEALAVPAEKRADHMRARADKLRLVA